METSEPTKELYAALAKAQGKFQPAKKSKKNPSLKNQYASLDDIIEAVRLPLSENELGFMQLLETDENGNMTLETRLFHSSGQFISTKVSVQSMASNRAVNQLQTLGGGLTYMKRYTLAAMLGVSADEDTDGNGATIQQPKRKPAQQKPKQEEKPKLFDPANVTDTDFGNDWIKMIETAVKTLDNVPDDETAKAAIKNHFGETKSTPLRGFVYLRDEYGKSIETDDEVF